MESWIFSIIPQWLFIFASQQRSCGSPWLTHFLSLQKFWVWGLFCTYLLPTSYDLLLPAWGRPYLEGTTTASPHWSPLLRHPDLSGPSCCGNCRFDHSPHFVRLHHMQAPLIGNSGLPKARQPGDQGQLPHCLVYKLVPSWRSDHHQEAGNSEMEIGAACEKGGLPLQAYLRFMHPRLRVQGEGPP